MSNWTRRAFAPHWVQRPKHKCFGGFFCFKQSLERDMDLLWNEIKFSTENGYLGHYSAISDDSQVICVHHSDETNLFERQYLEKQLSVIGIVANYYGTQWQSNGFTPDQYNQYRNNLETKDEQEFRTYLNNIRNGNVEHEYYTQSCPRHYLYK